MLEEQLTVSIPELKTMGKEEEQALFAAIRGGNEELGESLTECCIELVSEKASECKSSEVSYKEIFDGATEAIIGEIATFDCCGEESFYEHVARILDEMVKAFYNKLAWFLPISYKVIQLHDKYETVLLELYEGNDKAEDLSVQDEQCVADCMGITPDELRAMKSEYDMCRIRSLDESVTVNEREENDEYRVVPRVEAVPSPTDDIEAEEYLREVIECLSDLEKFILCARSGALKVEKRTYGQIAATLGIRESKVKSIYIRAINKIKNKGNQGE